MKSKRKLTGNAKFILETKSLSTDGFEQSVYRRDGEKMVLAGTLKGIVDPEGGLRITWCEPAKALSVTLA